MRKVRYVYRYQQAFNKLHISKEFWAWLLSLGNMQEKQYYHITNLRWSDETKNFKVRGIEIAEARTGRLWSKTIDPPPENSCRIYFIIILRRTSENQHIKLPYHHPFNHQLNNQHIKLPCHHHYNHQLNNQHIKLSTTLSLTLEPPV